MVFDIGSMADKTCGGSRCLRAWKFYPTRLERLYLSDWLEWRKSSLQNFLSLVTAGQVKNQILFYFDFAMTPLSTMPNRILRSFKNCFTPASRKFSFFLYQKDSIHSPGKCIARGSMTLNPTPWLGLWLKATPPLRRHSYCHYVEDRKGCDLHVERFFLKVSLMLNSSWEYLAFQTQEAR